VIRKAISERIGDVRSCYEQALDGWPQLEGRVVTKFVIGPDGLVTRSAVADNDTGLLGLGCCVNKAVETWRFPPPEGGGIVIVTYPFVLETTAADEDANGRPCAAALSCQY
jgi:hypothetical protein